MARTTAALIIADQLIICNATAKNAALSSSLASTTVRLHQATSDLATIGLENAKLSSSGSIRLAPDLLSWLGKFYILRKKGVDAGTMLNNWNKTCSTHAKVEGHKKQGLTALLLLPDEQIEKFLQHNELFEKPCFMEDAFANKKIMPGLFTPLIPCRMAMYPPIGVWFCVCVCGVGMGGGVGMST